MEIVLNATLAGGVAMGASADLINQTYGALLVGFVAGTVSALGFAYLTPLLQKHIGLHDTCGVHNLHAMPGVIGGITSAIMAKLAEHNFGDNYNG